MSNCPMGANQDHNAPWLKEPKEKIKVPVCVSVTYHKEITVEVPEDYDEVSLNYAVREALYTTHKHMDDNDWTEDEFEVVPE